MNTSIRNPLRAPALNHHVRAPLVVGMLAATFAVGIATGILVSRVGSGAGQPGVVIVAPRTSTMIDAWRLGDPAVVAAPAQPNRTVSSWLDIPAGVAAPAQPNRTVSSWLDIPAGVAAPAQPNRTVSSWLDIPARCDRSSAAEPDDRRLAARRAVKQK